MVLTPLAEILIQQDRMGNTGVAAPCFNYYYTMTGAVPMDATKLASSLDPLAPEVLHE
jgi:hypothetical protein